jgi:hypothetical protein
MRNLITYILLFEAFLLFKQNWLVTGLRCGCSLLNWGYNLEAKRLPTYLGHWAPLREREKN